MYWWSRYGSYRVGSYGLPHMGDVITDYSTRRGFYSQDAFAIAAGVSKRTIEYWETSAYIMDIERRILLAKLLRIPPALLGLTVHSVLDDTYAIEGYTDKLKQVTELAEEDSYYAYEDILIQGWEYVFNGRPLEIASRIERRLRKLIEITKNAPPLDQEAWQYLLCQFYQLHTNILRHFGTDSVNKANVLQANAEAVRIAENLGDVRLLAAAHYRSAQIHMEHDNYDLAKKTIQIAVDRMKHVTVPVKVNICLVAANANAKFTENDTSLEKEVEGWLDTALTIVHNGRIEDDPTLPMKPHLAAVHHEKAKTYMQFYALHPTKPQHLKDAHHELDLAWNALTPDLAEWRMYFALTESRLFLAEHDIEGSAQMALQALKQSKFIRSMKGDEQARNLYFQLKKHEKVNPYVENLGVALGIF